MAQSGVRELVIALLRCFGGILCGYVCVRFEWLDPGKDHLKGISFFVGKICFPVLVFKAMATADLKDFVWEVIFACNIAKVMAFVIAFLLFYFGKRSADQRLQVAAVYAFFVVCSNDFAIGYPVFGIVYPPDSYPQGLQTYLAINAVLLASMFMPVVLVLLSVATKLKTGEEGWLAGFDKQLLVDVLGAVLLNPAIVSAAAGFLWYLVVPGQGQDRIPYFLAQFLDLADSPFQMLALFLTGAGLKTVQLDKWAVVLVALKVLLCAYVGSALAQVLLPPSDSKSVLVSFTYLYGSIPTASAALMLAENFCPDYADLVATAVILSLAVAGPAMLLSSVLFVEDVNILNEIVADIVGVLTYYLSLPSAVALGLLFVVARRWFWAPPMDIVVVYGCSVILYTVSTASLLSSGCQEQNSEIQLAWQDAAENGFFILPSWRIIGYGVCQQLCRTLTIVLLIWRLRGFPVQGTKVAIAAAICVSGMIGLVVPPDTLDELCHLKSISWWRTPVTSALYLMVTVVSFAVPSYRPQAPRKSTAAAEVALAALHRPVAQGFLLHGLKAPLLKHVLTSTVFGLGIYTTIRLCMQSSSDLVVAFTANEDSVERGATFKEAMVIENVLEHSQAFFLLLLVLTGREYQPLTARLFSGSAGHRLEDEVLMDRDETKCLLDERGPDGFTLQEAIKARSKRRRFCCTRYGDCIPGNELVDLVLDRCHLSLGTRDEAIFICQALVTYGFLVHVDGRSQWFTDSDFAWYQPKQLAARDGLLEQSERHRVFTHAATMLGAGMVGPTIDEEGESRSTIHSARQSKNSLKTSRQNSSLGHLTLPSTSLVASQSLLHAHTFSSNAETQPTQPA